MGLRGWADRGGRGTRNRVKRRKRKGGMGRKQRGGGWEGMTGGWGIERGRGAGGRGQEQLLAGRDGADEPSCLASLCRST